MKTFGVNQIVVKLVLAAIVGICLSSESNKLILILLILISMVSIFSSTIIKIDSQKMVIFTFASMFRQPPIMLSEIQQLAINRSIKYPITTRIITTQIITIQQKGGGFRSYNVNFFKSELKALKTHLQTLGIDTVSSAV